MIDLLWKGRDREQREIVALIRRLRRGRPALRVLDVGCGFGRNLRALASEGVSVVGVDANPTSVASLRKDGYAVQTVDEFNADRAAEFDVVVMSHIIEHFAPDELVRFIDSYLSRLSSAGVLVIATPLLTSAFYEDFSHVRPYYPESLLMVYGEINPQISMRSAFRLAIETIWFRRSPFKVRFWVSCYRPRTLLSLRTIADSIFILMHRLSGGRIGMRDGWVASFRVGMRSAR